MIRSSLLHGTAIALLSWAFTAGTQAQVKVATLHPLLADLAKQVGAERVQVVELFRPGGDVHHFEPSAQDLVEMKGAAVIFASGLHLENYLENLRDSVAGVPVVEVGATLPVLKIRPGQEALFDEDVDVKSGVDPHWWHSLDNLQRAVRIVGEVLIKIDPAGTAVYKAGEAATSKRMAALKAWVHVQVAQIPRGDRKLVTAHAAFGYFCKEFGFTDMPLLGLSREDEATTKHVAQTIKAIRDSHIRAVFPEDQANPKILQEIVRETGVKLGAPLVADGTSPNAHTVETLFRHNVEAIVSALKPVAEGKTDQ